MTPEVKALVDRMQGFYERTQDFTADFKQEYHYKTFNRTVVSHRHGGLPEAREDALGVPDPVEAQLRALR